jgi:hypothetical protein
VNDTVEVIAQVPTLIDALANDYDPDGDPLEILDVETDGDVAIDGHSIIFTSDPLKIGHDTLMYRVTQVNNSTFYSDWTPVIVELATNPDLPVAVDDYYTVNGSTPQVINPLINDICNAADTLVIMSALSPKSLITELSDSTFEYRAYGHSSGLDIIKYIIKDKSNNELWAIGYIYVDILNQHFYDSLTINNISAGVNGDGMLFSRSDGMPGMGLAGYMFQLYMTQ